MKIIFILLISLCLFGACKTAKQPVIEVPVKTETKIVERLVPVTIHADSAVLSALFECDSLNNVRLIQLNELKSKGIESSFNLENNQLNYKVSKPPDVVYLPAKDSIIYTEKPVYVPQPYEVNRLTSWQHFQIWLGRIVMCFAIGYLAFKRLLK